MLVFHRSNGIDERVGFAGRSIQHCHLSIIIHSPLQWTRHVHSFGYCYSHHHFHHLVDCCCSPFFCFYLDEYVASAFLFSAVLFRHFFKRCDYYALRGCCCKWTNPVGCDDMVVTVQWVGSMVVATTEIEGRKEWNWQWWIVWLWWVRKESLV